MPERLVFFGDCHLAAEHPARTDAVLSFLDGVCTRATRVVCVGDLFDYWLGPDHVRSAEFARVLEALAALVRSGVPVDLIHGNRDFHLGRAFRRRTGVAVHRWGLDLTCGGQRVHVTHGDLLCSADVRYHKMRRLIRSWALRRLFLNLPSDIRARIARAMRAGSTREVAAKSERVLGIVPATVASRMARGADAIVCGHIHRQTTTHYLLADGRPGTLYTLGDWDASGGSFLEWRDGRFEFGRHDA